MQEAQLIKYDAKNPIIKLATAPAKPVGDHDLLIETKVAAVNPLDNLVSKPVTGSMPGLLWTIWGLLLKKSSSTSKQ